MARRKPWYTRRPEFTKRAAAPLLGVFVLFYLCFHAVSGDRGVVALFKESKRLAQIKQELEKVTSERAELDRKVHGLSSNSLDLDLLDERARLVLGLAGKAEIVYFLDSNRL